MEKPKSSRLRGKVSTAAERNAHRRRRFEEAGGRRIDVLLDAAAAEALDTLCRRHNVTVRTCVSELLIAAASVTGKETTTS